MDLLIELLYCKMLILINNVLSLHIRGFFATAFPVNLLFGHFMHDKIRVNEGLNGFLKTKNSNT